MPHVIVAASEDAFKELFAKVVEKFVFEDANSGDFGPFIASYDVKLHLDGGSVDLRADNTVQVKELDIKWDRLNLTLGVDIPELCIPSFCIIPNPFGGCILEFPGACVFSADPDIEIPLSLGGLVTSEVSLTATLLTKYFTNPDRPASMDQWDAQIADPKLFNEWRLFLDPQTVDVDIIDIADTVGDLLDEAIEDLVDGLLGGLPDAVREAIEALLGSAVDVVRDILDIGDDIQEWITDLLDVSFGLLDIIAQFVLDYFASKTPLLPLEDPYPIMNAAPNPNNLAGQPKLPDLLPVKIPIRDLTVSNNDVEMVLEGNVG